MESIKIRKEEVKFGNFSKSLLSDLSTIVGGCNSTSSRTRTNDCASDVDGDACLESGGSEL